MNVGISYINVIRFSLQLLVCELYFLWNVPRKPGTRWRAPLALLLYLASGKVAYSLLCLLPSFSSGVNGIFITLFFFLIFIVSMGMNAIVFRTDRWGYLFAGVGGYAVQHIVYSIAAIVKLYIFSGVYFTKFWDYLFFRTTPYVLGGWIVYHWLIRPSGWKGDTSKATPKKIVISGVILVSCLVLGTYTNQYPVETALLCRIYALIACMLGLYIQFLYTGQEWLERENEEMEKLLHAAQSQNKLSSDAVEIINMKCHDLKHQLVRLETRLDEQENRAVVQEISEAVNIYDSQVKTGCDALDIVLMQKNLLCDGHGIPFEYAGNAEKLNFMTSMDIAALVGNALDNAIESEIQEEEGKRFVNMSVKTQGNILLIHIDNPCSNMPVMKDGLPETTKEDKHYHGFGVKSIRYITEKYGGDMSVTMEDGVFSLDLIFSLPQAA